MIIWGTQKLEEGILHVKQREIQRTKGRLPSTRQHLLMPIPIDPLEVLVLLTYVTCI